MADANEIFERMADQFYKDTGVMAPGKDNPFILDSYELRTKLFAEWRARRILEATIAEREQTIRLLSDQQDMVQQQCAELRESLKWALTTMPIDDWSEANGFGPAVANYRKAAALLEKNDG